MNDLHSTPMGKKLAAVKGMNDIYPPESAQWEWFEQHVRALMGVCAYGSIRTPIVEYTQLFVKGTGETTAATGGTGQRLGGKLERAGRRLSQGRMPCRLVHATHFVGHR